MYIHEEDIPDSVVDVELDWDDYFNAKYDKKTKNVFVQTEEPEECGCCFRYYWEQFTENEGYSVEMRMDGKYHLIVEN